MEYIWYLDTPRSNFSSAVVILAWLFNLYTVKVSNAFPRVCAWILLWNLMAFSILHYWFIIFKIPASSMVILFFHYGIEFCKRKEWSQNFNLFLLLQADPHHPVLPSSATSPRPRSVSRGQHLRQTVVARSHTTSWSEDSEAHICGPTGRWSTTQAVLSIISSRIRSTPSGWRL